MSTLDQISTLFGRVAAPQAPPADRDTTAGLRQSLRLVHDSVEFSDDSIQRGRTGPDAYASDRVAEARETIRRGGYESDAVLDATADIVFAELQSIDLEA